MKNVYPQFIRKKIIDEKVKKKRENVILVSSMGTINSLVSIRHKTFII